MRVMLYSERNSRFHELFFRLNQSHFALKMDHVAHNQRVGLNFLQKKMSWKFAKLNAFYIMIFLFVS